MLVWQQLGTNGYTRPAWDGGPGGPARGTEVLD